MDQIKTTLTKHWYVLYTAPRNEKKVEITLTKEGYKVYLPKHITKRKWSDRVKEIEAPLFISYIFVYCNEFELRQALYLPGIVTFVRYDGKPAIVKQSEIDAISEFVTIAKHNKIISVGDLVKIVGGNFNKQTGQVVTLGKKYAYLRIESLNADICVERANIDK